VDNLIKIFCFDIDGTICTNTDGDYLKAKPHVQRIQHLNRLHHAGHTIKLFTARGSSTGFDWRELTILQLAQCEINYHELIMGKPHADLFIDDRAVHSEAYCWG